MRLKHIKGAEEAIFASSYVVQNPKEMKGKWNGGEYKKVAFEIGMGKGTFLTKLASQNPDILYIGIEKMSSVLLRVMQKQEELQLENLRLIREDAEYIEDFFENAEIDVIYLNFSDPWPKDRHEKRRLTSGHFLKKYTNILAPGGHIEFKTDNRSLFDFSVESVKESGWEIMALTYDLHNDPVLSEGNIMTEYEEKFSSEGKPICKIIAKP